MRFPDFRWWSVDSKLKTIHAVIEQRRTQLLAEVELELLALHDRNVMDAQRLNRRLVEITNSANVSVLMELGRYQELVSGRWRRRAVFEAPRLVALPVIVAKRRAMIADVDGRIRRAHALLDQLWRNPEKAEYLSVREPAAVVDELMQPVLTPVTRREVPV